MSATAGVSMPVRRRVDHLMGMPISLALRGRHAETERGAVAWGQVLATLSEADRVFSTYRPDSAISLLGRGELALEDCPIEVAEVLALAAEAERDSGGAFSAWLPEPDGTRRLDPSGVVKGWAVQRAAAHLQALDDTDYCLSAGGDMVCVVADPGRPAWQIGVEDPADPRRLIGRIPVRHGGVATSGTSHRGAHLLDARTGRAPAGVAAVTVVAETLTRADIDATAAYALGPDAERWLRTRHLLSALVVWPDGGTAVIDGRRAPRAAS